LENYLRFNNNVNSLFKSTNRYDFIVEGLFSQVKDVDEFIEDLEIKFPSLKFDTHFIVEDLFKEQILNLNN
jgi:hypothetical protein